MNAVRVKVERLGYAGGVVETYPLEMTQAEWFEFFREPMQRARAQLLEARRLRKLGEGQGW